MRIALFSDIHGNTVGLRAVLKHLEQQGGADERFALGDILAPGPGAEDVLELLDQSHTTMLRGNWDELFADPDAYIAALPTTLHQSSWEFYNWLTRNLSAHSQQRLAALPFSLTCMLPAGRRLYMCHAAPDNIASSTCTATTDSATLRAAYGSVDAEIIAYGHYHAHHVIQLDSHVLINVASVGMTYGKPSAYTLIDATDEHVAIRQYQVPYDREEYRHLLRVRDVPVTGGQQA